MALMMVTAVMVIARVRGQAVRVAQHGQPAVARGTDSSGPALSLRTGHPRSAEAEWRCALATVRGFVVVTGRCGFATCIGPGTGAGHRLTDTTKDIKGLRQFSQDHLPG